MKRSRNWVYEVREVSTELGEDHTSASLRTIPGPLQPMLGSEVYVETKTGPLYFELFGVVVERHGRDHKSESLRTMGAYVERCCGMDWSARIKQHCIMQEEYASSLMSQLAFLVEGSDMSSDWFSSDSPIKSIEQFL